LDIAVWLRDLRLERYAQVFRDAEISAEVLPDLTESDLRDLGLPLEPRKIVLKAIQALAGQQPTFFLSTESCVSLAMHCAGLATGDPQDAPRTCGWSLSPFRVRAIVRWSV